MKCVLLNIDTNKEIDVADSSVLGRNDFLMGSKKISRKHVKFNFTKDSKLLMEALHVNPCFAMRGGLPPIIVIKQNSTTELGSGDYLAFDDNDVWFEVKLTEQSQCNGYKKETTESTDLMSSDETNTQVVISPRLRETARLPVTEYQIDEVSSSISKTSTVSAPNCDSTLLESQTLVSHAVKRKVSLSPPDSPCKKTKTAEDIPSSSGSYISPEKNVEPALNVTIKKENEESTVKVEPDVDEPAAAHVPLQTNQTDDEKDAGPASVKKDDRRPMCPYESSCYRKNPAHKTEFAHPGDNDYVKPEDRPQCQYGPSCYRRNAQHRVDFNHTATTPPTPPRQASPPLRPKRTKGNDQCPSTPPKRKRQGNYKEEDSEEDPFVDDGSSDDYNPSDQEVSE